MERSLGIERVYNLGDYKSIRFSDTIDNLPEEIAMNQEIVDKIRYLQFINVESHYRQYIMLQKKVDPKLIELEEAMQFLSDEKATTMEELKNLIIKE